MTLGYDKCLIQRIVHGVLFCSRYVSSPNFLYFKFFQVLLNTLSKSVLIIQLIYDDWVVILEEDGPDLPFRLSCDVTHHAQQLDQWIDKFVASNIFIFYLMDSMLLNRKYEAYKHSEENRFLCTSLTSQLMNTAHHLETINLPCQRKFICYAKRRYKDTVPFLFYVLCIENGANLISQIVQKFLTLPAGTHI